MNSIELYRDVAKNMILAADDISRLWGSLWVDRFDSETEEDRNKLFEAIHTFANGLSVTEECLKFARDRMTGFAKFDDDAFINVAAANEITEKLNSKTLNIREVKEFIDNDYLKVSKIMTSYQRDILKEYTGEYASTLEIIVKWILKLRRKQADLVVPNKL